MKSVMISIRPKWCELIANGRKTIEVRKTRPKLETPFKCYIYCTQARNPIRVFGRILMYEDDLALTNRWGQGKLVANPYGAMMEGEFFLNGKVIGEFVCEEIKTYYADDFVGAEDLDGTIITAPKDGEFAYWIPEEGICLSYNEICAYGNGKTLYGWHISDLVIYDKPMELSEFVKPCNYNCFAPCPYYQGKEYECEKPIITRPPQSWCYVGNAAE